MRRLGAKSITALVVPDREVAWQILALNTEKAHNLKERSLEVIRIYRGLVEEDATRPESSFSFYLKEAAFATLGICLEKERAPFDWANTLQNRGLCGSRGVGESHLKPRTCQLAHIVALQLSFVQSEEVVGPQILEMSVGLEHGVANHQNAVGNRQGRLLGTAPGGDALILGTKIAAFVFDGRPRSL